MTRGRPVITITLVLASLVTFCWPGLSDQCIYDRQAVWNGEVWRIFTAPLAHFSVSHWFWDMLLFTVFGSILETLNRNSFLNILLLTAVASGLTYLLFTPELAYYGGMSGVATGLVAYLGLHKATSRADKEWLWHVILGLLLIKITFEIIADRPLFVPVQDLSFAVLPSAHLIGIATAMIVVFWRSIFNSASKPRRLSLRKPG